MSEHVDPLDKWTLSLTSDGDIAWDEEMNRPETIDGLQAVKQDLLVSLDTYKGEDPLDEDFGLDVFEAVGHVDTLRAEVERTVMYDDYRHNRVDAVTDITLEQSAHGSRDYTVHITAELDDGEPLTFIFDLFRGSLTVA